MAQSFSNQFPLPSFTIIIGLLASFHFRIFRFPFLLPVHLCRIFVTTYFPCFHLQIPTNPTNLIEPMLFCHFWMRRRNIYLAIQFPLSLLFFPIIFAHSAKDYDESRVPDNLRPISWLLGVWRSEHDGKAMFPTIPKFTYGEEISISLSDSHLNSEPAFNYTAFAWSSHDKDELHSENGFITVYSGTTRVALTTVMNNGFVTVEEGPVSNYRIRFKLVDIGRISFSRDLPVHDLVREWTLVDGSHLESRLDMETLTHGMREHTVITYTKIFP